MNSRSMFISFSSIASVLLIITSVISCKHDPLIPADIDTICFESQVLPLLQTSCGIQGCHDAATASEGFVAVSYESVISYVSPGDPRGSLLYSVITDITAEHFMPPGRPLTQEQRTLIHLWIAQGALNTECPYNGDGNQNGDTTGSDSVCFIQDILPILLSSCGISGCHDAASHAEGYVLTNYSTLMQNSEAIVPFNPAESKIYKVITENEAEDRMPPPPNSSLSSKQTGLFYTWIKQGALNSDCPEKSCDTTAAIEFSTQVWPVIENNCLSCHNSSLSRGGVNLDGYQQVKYYSENLRNGIPVILGVINYMNGFSNMPPSKKLDDCTIRIIELWIEQGIHNN